MPLAVLIVVLGAGCVTSADVTDHAVRATAPRERVDFDAELTGCDHADAYVPVPASAVAPHVPDDFDVAVTPSGPDGQPVALAFVGLLLCDRFSANGEEGRGDFAWVDVAVSPKDASLRDDSRNVYLLRLEHYVLPGALQVVQASLGDRHVAADSIEFRMQPTSAGLTVASGPVRLEVDAASSGAAPTAPFAGLRLREFGLAEGGYTYVDLTVAPATPTMGLAPATVHSSPDSVAFKIMGERASATLATARFDFAEGRIGFIPAP